jgi:ABC-type Fe3+/spermidine/putrescine transport system ATPase subunit
MSAMIELEHLGKRYPGQSVAAVDALDLTIAEGEIVILVGPSGCGKTTDAEDDQPHHRAHLRHDPATG